MNKKIITLLMAASLMVSSTAVFAADAATAVDAGEQVAAIETAKNFVKLELTAEAVEGKRISCTNAEGEEIIINAADSYIFDDYGDRADADLIEKGTVIDVYVSANAPAPLILPAEYTAAVIAVKGDYMTDVDVYTKSEDGYVNDANTLELLISDNTRNVQFVDVDMNPLMSLDGEKALVYYTNSTKSIPAQTTPEKIIILPSSIGEAAEELPEVKDLSENAPCFTSWRVTIEDVKDGYATAKTEDGAHVDVFVSEETVYFDADGNRTNGDLKKDDKVVLFQNKFKSSRIADVVVAADEMKNVDVDAYVKSDTFGEVVNKAFTLALNIGDDTEIVDAKNKMAMTKDDLAGKYLAVFYEKVALSIPGQTTPSKIVILGEAPEEASEAAAPVEEKPMYDDIDKDSKYYEAVKFVTEKGLMNGFGDGSFLPETQFTRAQLAKISAVLRYGANEDGTYDDTCADGYDKEQSFTDVEKSHWAFGFIGKLTDDKLLNGRGDGKFDPEAAVSFAEASKMIVNGVTGKGDLAYPDGFIKEAKDSGMLEKLDEYDNNAPIIRGDIAIMLYNALK